MGKKVDTISLNLQKLVRAFAKLRNGTIYFVMSVCPSVSLSVRTENPGSK